MHSGLHGERQMIRSELIPSHSKRATTRGRTLGAWLAVIPLGIGSALMVWASGMGSLCALAFVATCGPLILFLIARHSFIPLGLLFDLTLSLALLFHAIQFDKEIQRPLEFTRHAGMFAIIVAISAGLTFMIAAPVALMMIPTPFPLQSPPPASPGD